MEKIRDHIRTVHDYKRVSIADADQDPANQKTTDWDVGQVLMLPDPTPNGQVVNYIPVTKLKEKQIRRFTIRVAMNGEKLHAKLMAHNLNLPPDTPMSVDALQDPPADLELATLFGALREVQNHFVYFKNPIQYDLIALASIASYFREVFRTFPFIGFLSPERGWGKTTATKATVYAGYNGVFFTIPSEASFFRIVQDSGGTVGIDQVDDILANPQKNKDLLALLDGAHQKGTFVPRCEKDDQGKTLVYFYDPFSVVVFNGTELIPPSLLSRSIVITMTECAGRKKLRKNPIPEDFKHVRDQIYIWRLRHWQKVQSVYDEIISQGLLLDRNEDIFLPILTIAKIIAQELFDTVLEYAKTSYAQTRAKRLNTWVQALVEMLPEFIGITEIVTIRDSMNDKLVEMGELQLNRDGQPKRPLGSRWVVKSLESLGFERASRGPGTGRTRYHITQDRVDELLHIYQDLITKEALSTQNASQSSQPSQLTLDSKETGEECEESEAILGIRDKLRKEDYRNRLNNLLNFMREMAKEAKNGIIEVVLLFKRCKLAGWTGYTHTDLDADLEQLKKEDKIIEVNVGGYRLV